MPHYNHDKKKCNSKFCSFKVATRPAFEVLGNNIREAKPGVPTGCFTRKWLVIRFGLGLKDIRIQSGLSFWGRHLLKCLIDIQRIKRFTYDLMDSHFFYVSRGRGLHDQCRVRPASGTRYDNHLFAARQKTGVSCHQGNFKTNFGSLTETSK